MALIVDLQEINCRSSLLIIAIKKKEVKIHLLPTGQLFWIHWRLNYSFWVELQLSLQFTVAGTVLH